MRKVLCILFALTCVFVLSACGGKTEEKIYDSGSIESDPANVATDDVKTEIEDIVANAVKCTTKIFDTVTLDYDAENPYKDNYCLVKSDEFTSYAQLEEFVRSTYVKDLADSILSGKAGSTTLYADVDGKLCIDKTSVLGRGYYVDWDSFSVTIDKVDGDRCTLTVNTTMTEPAEEPQPEPYSVNATAKKVDGKWLLETIIR